MGCNGSTAHEVYVDKNSKTGAVAAKRSSFLWPRRAESVRLMLEPEAEDSATARGKSFQKYVNNLVEEYRRKVEARDAFHMVEQAIVGNLLEGCIFVGHINTDLDSVAGALGASALFGGIPAKAEETLNGEITFALDFAGLQAPQLFDKIPGGGAPDGGELKKVCLVDHNEAKQMTQKLRDCPKRKDRIIGLIDHHAVSEAFCTERSLFMDVRPWGSMSSIVAHTFIRESIPMPKSIARILLCAILSDTLNLKSVTATPADRLMVAVLGAIAEVGSFVEVSELAKQQFRAKTDWIVRLGPRAMVLGDQKDFTANGSKLSISVLEVTAPEAVRPKLAQLAKELNTLKEQKGLNYAMCFIVDVGERCSELVISGAGELALARAAFPNGKICGSDGWAAGAEPDEKTLTAEGALMDVGNLVSRKAEFAPAVLKALNDGFAYRPNSE